MWNGLPCTVFDTVDGFVECLLNGFKGAVNRWLLPWVVFSSVFRDAGDCGVTKAIYQQLCFSHFFPKQRKRQILHTYNSKN